MRKNSCLKHVILSRPHRDVLIDWSFCTESTAPTLRGGQGRSCHIVKSSSWQSDEHEETWRTCPPSPLGDLARQGRGLPKSHSSQDGRLETVRLNQQPASFWPSLPQHSLSLQSSHLFCSIFSLWISHLIPVCSLIQESCKRLNGNLRQPQGSWRHLHLLPQQLVKTFAQYMKEEKQA